MKKLTIILTATAAFLATAPAANAQQYNGPVYNDVYGTVPTSRPTPSPYGPGYRYGYRSGYYAYGYYRPRRWYHRYYY